jgi:hypothetical protein
MPVSNSDRAMWWVRLRNSRAMPRRCSSRRRVRGVLQLVDLHGDVVGTLPIADGAATVTRSGSLTPPPGPVGPNRSRPPRRARLQTPRRDHHRRGCLDCDRQPPSLGRWYRMDARRQPQPRRPTHQRRRRHHRRTGCRRPGRGARPDRLQPVSSQRPHLLRRQS